MASRAPGEKTVRHTRTIGQCALSSGAAPSAALSAGQIGAHTPPGTGSLTAIISRARNPKLREVKRPAWEHTVSRGGTGTQIQACRAHGAQQLPGEQSPLLSAASPTLKQESQ